MQAFDTLDLRRELPHPVPVASPAAARPRPAALAPTLLLLDARPLVRECLARGLAAEWPEARIAALGFEALPELAAGEAAAPVDVCLVSVDAAGIELLPAVAAALPATPLVVLSDERGGGTASVARAAALGARAYFSTAAALPVLAQGVRLVLVGGCAFPCPGSGAGVMGAAPAASARRPPPPSRFAAELFTPKEAEVLGCLARGRQNKLIAHELAICETTVKVHLRHIFRKLGTTNRTHAALLAREMLEEAPR